MFCLNDVHMNEWDQIQTSPVPQTKIEPEFVLFFDCSEEEMQQRILGRNQVLDLFF